MHIVRKKNNPKCQGKKNISTNKTKDKQQSFFNVDEVATK